MENSGLSLYDGNGKVCCWQLFSLGFFYEQSLDCEYFFHLFLVSNEDVGSTSQNVSYDVSKLVDFPGFNVAAPHQMKDVRFTTFQTKC